MCRDQDLFAQTVVVMEVVELQANTRIDSLISWQHMEQDTEVMVNGLDMEVILGLDLGLDHLVRITTIQV